MKFLIIFLLYLYQSDGCKSEVKYEAKSEINENLIRKFHNPYYFDNRTGIVHLFEWKFSDIAKECEEFLGPNGYAGVQTSPVSENLIIENRPWYERYQPVSYEIHTRSGGVQEFYDMTERCRVAGVRVYVDIVINHMTSNLTGYGSGGSIIDSFNLTYPSVPYNQNDFNVPLCQIINYTDPIEARNCELDGLHDLNHRSQNVRWSIILFLNRLTALGAAGFRVDASKHMWPEDLKYIYDNIRDLPTKYDFPKNSKPFIYQEVQGNWKHNYAHLGAVTEFTYAAVMAEIFRGKKSILDLYEIGDNSWEMLINDSALIFIDNHDLQRQSELTLTYKDTKLFKAAYAFALAHNYGIPRIMSSYHFNNNDEGPPHDTNFNILSPQYDKNDQCINGWVCEHRWLSIRNMIEFRNLIGNNPLKEWHNYGNSTISFCRGNIGFILVNNGIDEYIGEIQTCLPKGIYCNVMVGKLNDNGKCINNWKINVDSNGKANITINKSSDEFVIALHVNAKEI